MEPARLPWMLGPAMLPTFAPPHEEVRCADLPGNRKIGVAPLHGSRRGPPAPPSQRPRREAITQRRQADTPREEVMREYQQRFAGDGYWAADLKADFNDSNSSTVGTEFVGPSITSGGDCADTQVGGEPIPTPPTAEGVSAAIELYSERIEVQERADRESRSRR